MLLVRKTIILIVFHHIYLIPIKMTEGAESPRYIGRFAKALTKVCTPGGMRTKSYNSFGLAAYDCQRDNECIAIDEETYDGMTKFNLCEEINQISNGVITSSGIYMENIGKIRRVKCSLK